MWESALAGFEHWLRAAAQSEGTIGLRMRYLRQFAKLAPFPFDVDPDTLARFLARPDWAPETRKSARATLCVFYRWAIIVGRIDTDPTFALQPVVVPSGRPRPAPESVVADALARADLRGRRMVMLAAFAGLRCCEIAAVHSDDIADGVLRVRGKGGKVRLIPLPPAMITALRVEPGFMFPGRFDEHMRPNSVGVVLKRLLGPNWSGHNLRHRFASRAYGATHDIRAVQTLLGHAKLETTMIYTAVPDDALRAAVAAANVLVA